MNQFLELIMEFMILAKTENKGNNQKVDPNIQKCVNGNNIRVRST